MLLDEGDVNVVRAGIMDRNTIMQIQQKLNQQGFDAGETDGNLGPGTQAAVQSYQHDEGIGVPAGIRAPAKRGAGKGEATGLIIVLQGQGGRAGVRRR